MIPLKYKSASNSRMTIGTTAVNMREFLIDNNEQEIANNASSWLITCVSEGITILTNGNTPTSSLGTPMSAGQSYAFNGVEASQITMIQSGGTNAVIAVEPSKAVKGFGMTAPSSSGGGNTSDSLNPSFNTVGFNEITDVTYDATTTTIDWGISNVQKATLTGDIGTLAFTDPDTSQVGQSVKLELIQDATGSRTVTAWDSDIKWAGGTAPTLSTTASAVDWVVCIWDGTKYDCSASLDFS